MQVFHSDHSLSQVHFDLIESTIQSSDTKGFFIRTIPVPAHLPAVLSALYGPQEGDAPLWEGECSYSTRGDRGGLSRRVDCPMREARNIVAIGEVGEDGSITLYTAYGSLSGRAAPREPYDASLLSDVVAWQESQDFWSEHALSTSC